jgi:hypothetical protein
MPGRVLHLLLGFCVVIILWAPGVHAQQIDVSLEPLPSSLFARSFCQFRNLAWR